MLQVSENEVKSRLQFDNPWWEEGAGIDSMRREYPRRSYFLPFYKLVVDESVNRAIVLMGPRRVGKTVMVYHTIQELLSKGVEAKKILYLSLGTPIYTGLSLEKLVILFQIFFNHKRDDRLYIFFDEIQYLKNWEIHLKSLVDSFNAYKFIATGSAAAALRLKSQESGAGRFSDFILPPLTFSEYLLFISREEELISCEIGEDDRPVYSALDISTLNSEFINYLNYGGYPEAVFSRTIQLNSGQYIKSDIIDKVLLRDLPSLYGINDIQELNRLFTVVAYNTANEINLEGLSQSAGIAKNTIKKYLEYLEAAFLIKRVHRVDQNSKRFKRETFFKVYLTNPSMRAALFGNIDENHESTGTLTETAIYSQWLHSDTIERLHYARWKEGEVDLVYLDLESQTPDWLVEVKWSDRVITDMTDIKGTLYFADKHSKHLCEKSIKVTTKTKSVKKYYKDKLIEFIPSSLYAYTVGKNLTYRLIGRYPKT